MKLLGTTDNKITRVKNSENISYLQTTALILVYLNLTNNSSRVLYAFATNKSFEKYLEISPKKVQIFKDI